MFSCQHFSLQDRARLESEAFHSLAVDELDLIPWNGVALRVLTFSIADLATFHWLIKLEAFRAFARDFQLELTEQQGFGTVLGGEPSRHDAVPVR